MKNKTNKNLKLDKIQISKLSKLEAIKGGSNYNTYSSNCATNDDKPSKMTTKTAPTDLDWM